MLKDRGNKKWQGFFLTEHVAALREYEKNIVKIPKPNLDEWQMQDINDLLVLSLQDEEPLTLTLWVDGYFEQISPFIVTKIDPYQRKLIGLVEGEQTSISFDALVEVERK
ncbi:YolD-like family protein (plasmid) [Ureibacillus chungkukjangi]|uniref:YolD-like family protein n=1 Tax=Ureibacillus chungkukjangi TaxID=1202712 RepID=UPI00187D53E3|nr:YolD-like family protein [Ureibacillus chungkukjangi]MCM3390546.1 YolD-like family protein [Ureibacillus chungkukjangi]